MGIYDRDWYREERARKEGRSTHRAPAFKAGDKVPSNGEKVEKRKLRTPSANVRKDRVAGLKKLRSAYNKNDRLDCEYRPKEFRRDNRQDSPPELPVSDILLFCFGLVTGWLAFLIILILSPQTLRPMIDLMRSLLSLLNG